MNFDFWLFQQINGLAGRWDWLDFLGVFLASYFQYFVVLALIVFLFIGKDRGEKMKNMAMVALSIMAIVLARLGITAFLHWAFMRPRPFVAHAVNQLIPYAATESSFPSGHAAFFFALATVVYFYNKKVYPERSRRGWYFLAAAALISLARVFVGVHYMSDILVGALIGVFSGWLVWWLYNLYQNKKAR
ncbi:MAG TPA: phosphatase PAP2 family protein [Candidatus Portnoybacteria bacterium]|nr:phosphatase PAP2 family protein [Candidatus Portnoybacteria bacterium]